MNRISELSAAIAKHTATIDGYFTSNGLPTPSLEADALWNLPIPDGATDIKQARVAVIEACSELRDLMTGPKELLKFEWTAYVSVKVILRFRLDQSFPVGESTTFEAMSQYSGLSAKQVRRFVKHAILNHRLFQEKSPGVITHSALTAVLASEEIARNAFVVQLDEFWPAGIRVADALEKWPGSEENNETGFSLVNNSSKSLYDILAADPVRNARFGMLFNRPDEPLDLIIENYPWQDFNSVVDVGGSHGAVAIAIAEKFPHMKCIVQDLPETVKEGAARLPVKLEDRVEFMVQDFFTPQRITADVYYLRSILHNWSDKYCIKILQNLVPALKNGSRIIIHERVLPDVDQLAGVDAKPAINLDIGMLQLLNAQQREMHEWPALLQRADHRFQFLGAKKPDGAIRWICEAVWIEGDERRGFPAQ
ncbi:S-adenosyl-L-methionine-dependent methyltransferase [Polyplosphaeria fusca]|uniref:S-adenosyl-L-methionine-dependent methyltransferase n=1 Tax=Polyplosphaeria fusca TaxID=682080 RepID=A0A9P4QZU4_9PLEO|nr:S-adenosyl-L-methionine-dependent methyltransferase [Polyplosphaeria fusca]